MIFKKYTFLKKNRTLFFCLFVCFQFWILREWALGNGSQILTILTKDFHSTIPEGGSLWHRDRCPFPGGEDCMRVPCSLVMGFVPLSPRNSTEPCVDDSCQHSGSEMTSLTLRLKVALGVQGGNLKLACSCFLLV